LDSMVSFVNCCNFTQLWLEGFSV